MNDFLKKITNAISEIDERAIVSIAQEVENVTVSGGKILIFGNGGSAAIASHIAIDFINVLKLRTLNLSDPSIITCLANDYGYENWIDEGLNTFLDEGDLVILISSSGRSPNIINAAKKAVARKARLVSLSGFSSQNELRNLGDVSVWVDSTNYNVVESTHQTILMAAFEKLKNERAS